VDSALSRISKWMTEGAVALNLEYQPNPHRLDLTHLTVVADTEDRDVRMSQMGSAENWLGCHLVSHMTLHRWFAIKRRPVPRFLFIDQPTSAYYPPDNPSKATDKDRAAVARMYKWLAATVSKLQPTFQLLIVDHADLDEPWFKDCVVERWRDGQALVPQAWLANEAGQSAST
jgi:hypothetical protein